MEKLTMKNAWLRYVDLRSGPEGVNVFTRLHLTADYSEAIEKKMEWENPGDSIKSANLIGEFARGHINLTPKGKGVTQLKGFALDLDISDVTHFKLVVTKDAEGAVVSRELRFIARSTDPNAEGWCGSYMRQIGKHKGDLKISYTVAVQEKLPIPVPAEDDTSQYEEEEEDFEEETQDAAV